MRALLVALVAWFGNPLDWLDHWRIWLSLLLGALLVALVYGLVLPDTAPLWPGVVAVGVAVFCGVAWQHHADRQ